MAEVAVAIAGAVQAIAIAAAVCAVVALVWMIWAQVFQLIPYAGSLLIGALFAMVFNSMDPFLGMGLGFGFALAAYPPLKVFVATQYKTTDNTLPSGLQLAMAMKGVSQGLCAGAALGFAHAATKSIPFSLAAAAAGFYVGGKYAWTGLTNFYIDIGFFGQMNCASKKYPNMTGCVNACDAKTAKATADAVWTKAPCLNNEDPHVHAWCQREAAYVSQCAWDATLTNPGVAPQPGTWRSPAADQRCSSYPAWVSTGEYMFSDVCKPSDDLNNFIKTFTPQSPPNVQPLSEAMYLAWYGQNNAYQRLDYEFAKDNYGNIIEGRIRMTDKTKGDLDISHMLWGKEAGTLKAIPLGTFVCVWTLVSNEGTWWFVSQQGAPTGAPPAKPNLNYTVFDMSKAPPYLSNVWGNREACVPTVLDDKDQLNPMWLLDIQPVEADRKSFCAHYDEDSKKAGTGVSRIFPSYANKKFQCYTGPGVIQPSYGLDWPKQ